MLVYWICLLVTAVQLSRRHIIRETFSVLGSDTVFIGNLSRKFGGLAASMFRLVTEFEFYFPCPEDDSSAMLVSTLPVSTASHPTGV